MNVLEIDCHNCNCFNMLFVSDIKLDKIFTCDSCESPILICDKEFIDQMVS